MTTATAFVTAKIGAWRAFTYDLAMNLWKPVENFTASGENTPQDYRALSLPERRDLSKVVSDLVEQQGLGKFDVQKPNLGLTNPTIVRSVDDANGLLQHGP